MPRKREFEIVVSNGEEFRSNPMNAVACVRELPRPFILAAAEEVRRWQPCKK